MNLTIQSDERLPIRMTIQSPERPRALAIVVHGFKGFMQWGFFPWLSDVLRLHGIAVCRFNMSRSGIGEDPEAFDRLDLFRDDTYSIQLADLRAVVARAQAELPGLSTFLLGHSRGGAVALLGAEEVPDLQGVITWSAISHLSRWDDATIAGWRAAGSLDVVNQRTGQLMKMSTAVLDDYLAHRERLDVVAAARRLEVPLLVVHGRRDESVPVAEASEIAGAANDASLMLIDRASHTYNAIHPLVHVPVELSVAAEVSAHFINAYV
ncbi:MAG: alpha/beta hydrolase [Thermoanaerobaculia bacterium]